MEFMTLNSNDIVSAYVNGTKASGRFSAVARRNEPILLNLEKLWAYMKITDLLSEESISKLGQHTTEALELALNYKYVTPVSSLVVKQKGNEQNKIDVRLGVPNKGGKGDVLTAGHGFPTSTTQPPVPELMNIPEGCTTNVSSLDWISNRIVEEQGLLDLRGEGNYKIGFDGMNNLIGEQCDEVPYGESGRCTILLCCPKVFDKISTMQEYMNYFCTVDKFAGVCCPN